MNLEPTRTVKRIQLLLLILSATGLVGRTPFARAADPAGTGLVAAWNFDETTGDKAKDISGHGHHGTMRGVTRTAGKFGGAIGCGQDAPVEVPHVATLDEFKQGITVSAWVNCSANTNWNTVISREVKDGWSEYFGLAVVKSKALFSVDPDGAHYQNIKSDERMPLGEWIYLAGTYDTAVFRLYVNGRLVKSASCSVPFKFADQNPILIGGNTNTKGKSWVDCFRGRIDEVRLYNRALTDVEVLRISSLPLGLKPPSSVNATPASGPTAP